MPKKPGLFRPSHLPTRQQQQRDYDRERGERLPWRSWYSLALWRHPVHGLRAVQLKRQPLCETCLAAKPQRLTPATVAHHRQPHKGRWALFADLRNLASACAPCHDSLLQSEERAMERKP